MARRRTKEKPLLQWFGLDPWDFLNKTGCWITRGDERVYLEGAYKSPTGRLLALDWEHPAAFSEVGRLAGFPCLKCGCTTTLNSLVQWHPAWVLLQCRLCEKQYYCFSGKQQAVCPGCSRGKRGQVGLNNLEPEIVKLVCGKHLVPQLWSVREENWGRTVRV